jgi:hypothetical protein
MQIRTAVFQDRWMCREEPQTKAIIVLFRMSAKNRTKAAIARRDEVLV